MNRLMLVFTIILSMSCDKNPVDNNYKIASEERILFIRSVDGFSQICTIKPDGTGLIIISQTKPPNLNNAGYIQARWSPDKSKIVIVGGPESTRDIFALWLMDMNGNLLQKLSNNGFHPIWKNNNEIFYHKPRRFVGSTQDIYLINIQERKESLIYQQTDSLVIQLSDINSTGEYGVGYLWDIATNKEKISVIAGFKIGIWSNRNILYTDDVYHGVQPRLSQNEERLTFVKGIYQNNDIYLLELSTGNITNLTNNLSEYFNVTWSPDNKKIAYYTPEDRPFAPSIAEIYVIDILTGNVINLTNTASENISNRIMDWK